MEKLMYAPVSRRSTVRRVARRASYDPALVFAILDAGLVAHVAFVHDHHPFVIPMAYVRRDRELMLHGAAASRMLEVGAAGAPVSACVTLLDGLVYARSAFHHSVNYRSVVVLGQAREVTGEAEKRAFLEALVERVAPGRARLVRGPSAKELHATRVIALPIDEASAKVRTGGPVDDAEDLALPVWAGQLPVAIRAMSHIPTPDGAPEFALPARPAGIDSASPGEPRHRRSDRSSGGVPRGAELTSMGCACVSSKPGACSAQIASFGLWNLRSLGRIDLDRLDRRNETRQATARTGVASGARLR